jgi:hypothetical protein
MRYVIWGVHTANVFPRPMLYPHWCNTIPNFHIRRDRAPKN